MKWLLIILALWPQLLHAQDKFSGDIKSSAISFTSPIEDDIDATILFLEYKDQGIWYGIGGYGFAAATGVLRMFNNKHWVSDVIPGRE
jgi:hypothetical protein